MQTGDKILLHHPWWNKQGSVMCQILRVYPDNWVDLRPLTGNPHLRFVHLEEKSWSPVGENQCS